jgi:hypothetical protein
MVMLRDEMFIEIFRPKTLGIMHLSPHFCCSSRNLLIFVKFQSVGE